MLVPDKGRDSLKQRLEYYSAASILATVRPQYLNRHLISLELKVRNHQFLVLLNLSLTNDCYDLVFPGREGVLEGICKVKLRVVVIEN